MAADTDQFDDLGIFARTLYGEARGEGQLGMEAVACVVLNRLASGVTWWGTDVRSICLKPYQFSSWNDKDPNRPLMLAVTDADSVFVSAEQIAQQAVQGELDDPTHGATSYFDRRMPVPPVWAKNVDPCAVIGHHAFYKIGI